VPKERLSPQRPWSEQIGKEDHAELIAPDNSRWKVRIDAEGDAVLLHIRDAVEPGLYRLKLPEFIRQSVGNLLDRDGHVPFAVRGDVEESRLTGLSEREMDQVSQHADFFRADSSEQMTTVIAGGIPGHELWRYLAVAALIAVLAEAALTRWIAQQRRVGAVEPVDFTSGAVDPAAFRRRAKELLKVGSSN